MRERGSRNFGKFWERNAWTSSKSSNVARLVKSRLENEIKIQLYSINNKKKIDLAFSILDRINLLNSEHLTPFITENLHN